ncbi:hypothetical protein N7U66_03475 [Lacinutrix neustonica]|uniref:Cell surface protein SprA n=1 Tax=Lacinutrix neustonica TaxID=2980107 RepID=A0A9E8MYT3_9FLAO|nr:hypothetical protein [Lacinutrix neustonica]WAC02745.1 hypothetical protein N7U66_03475 [Lacinutrix neustonica]
MNRSETGVTFSASINPFTLFKKQKPDNSRHRWPKKTKKEDPDNKEKTKNQDEDKKIVVKTGVNGGGYGNFNAASLFGLQTFTDVGQSVSLTKMKGMNVNLSYGLQINPAFIPVAVERGYIGTFSVNNSIPYETIEATGYLGSSNAGRADHFTEKAQPFDKRDFFIGIPYSSPDNHSLSGEGLSGGFRAYADGPRAFSNEQGSSKIRTYGVGVEGMIGTNVGVGVNLSFGSNTSKMEARSDIGGKTHDNINYRFYGDLGGKVSFANNKIANVELNANPDFPGIKQVQKNVNDVNAFKEDNTDVSMNSSSFIEKMDDGGFGINSEAGTKYEYTEPIKVRNVSSLAFGINENDDIENNYLAYTKTYLSNEYIVNTCDQNTVSGEIKKVPYENTSLLELITTPDYIDLGQEGPDDDDFGGWTAFEYHKRYGEDSDMARWYRWRIPYNGLLYSKNSISDVKDDTGYVNTGEKEVNYLKKVETKTHVAYFVTNKSDAARFGVSGDIAQFLNGSLKDRYDGLGAPELTSVEDPSSDPLNKSLKGVDQLEYLEKIVLFSKARPEIPLQVTNFQYDYSLVQNLPNNINGNFPGNKTSNESGKLTLKKVWSEFEGVVDARISSYKFGYQYTNNHQNTTSYSLAAQNPDYGPHLLDPWGFNQFDGMGSENSATNRHLNLITWPYQGDIPNRNSILLLGN